MVEFINQPADYCNWVDYPYLIAGKPPKTTEPFVDIFVSVYQHQSEIFDISKLSNLILAVETAVKEKKRVYIYDGGKCDLLLIFVACYLQSTEKWAPERSRIYAQTVLPISVKLKPRQLSQINKYQRPVVALFCGDRNSATAFETMISFELTSLPLRSVVVHGGCKGIDLYAAELAKLKGIECREYPANWLQYGRAAGPIRNAQMINEESIDVVFAFHPNIEESKGTKNMILQAYKKGIPVFVHDYKRKSKFEGDFEAL